MSTHIHAEIKPGVAAASFTPARSGLLQRKCECGGSAGLTGQCSECDEERLTLQRHAADQPPINAVPPIVDEVLRSPGQSLDGVTRAFMESRFGHDLSQVRVHADPRASASARAVNAMAYTVGKDVVFQTGQYRPQTEAGKRLLAHELTHVVQQGGADLGLARNNRGSGLVLSQPGDRAEQEADRGAEAVTTGGSFAPSVKAAPGTAGATIHRADDEWNKAYGTPKSFLQKPFDEFKAGLGEIKATTQGGLTENKGRPLTERQKGAPTGTPAVPEINFDVLKEIYPGLEADVTSYLAKLLSLRFLPRFLRSYLQAAVKEKKEKEKKAQDYLGHLNKAFKIMKIDTVEAQSVYLAHAFVESDQFRQFTETQGWMDAAGTGTQKWEDDPAKLKLNMKYLEETYSKTDTEDERKRQKSVNPHGKFEFIGRGPIQVTHKAEYVEVIAMLEKTADQYQKEADAGNAEAKEHVKLARRAAKDIKADPRKAAAPEYTFLVSAAVMKKQGADVSAATVKTGTPWTGADAASGWVAGGKQKKDSPQGKALIAKSNAYDKIYPVLLREANKKKPAAQTATP